MFVDEEKVRQKSAEMGTGPKGLFPSFRRFKKPRNPHEKFLAAARVFIGFCLAAGMVAGIVILLYVFAQTGGNFAQNLKKKEANKQYIEVIYKPKTPAE